jgi:CheY-like chemotaxis protein
MSSKVLIVEDDSTTRRLVHFVLKPLEVDVIDAANATEAKAAVQQQAFQLILMDLNLPGMDGFLLIELLREHEHAATTPVIVLTARSNPADTSRAQQMGCAGFLYKPFGTQALRSIVARTLGLPE